MEYRVEHFYLFLSKVKKGMTGKKLIWDFDCYISPKMRKIPWVYNKITEFYSYYRSNHFSEIDYQIYVLEKCIEHDDFLTNMTKWNVRDVKKISKEDLKNDQEFILKVSEKSKVKDLKIFFDINTNGESLISSFYEKKLVSIQFLARYSQYFVRRENETEKHKKLVEITKIAKQILN